PLILNQPFPPSRTANVIGRLNRARAVGNRVGRVGDVAVKRARAGLRRRVERELAVRAKIELAVGREVARRPLVVTLPFVRPGLECDRLRDSELAFVFQPVGEPGRFDLFAVILRGVAVEFDFAETTPVRTRPAAVIPRTRNEEIDPLLVVRLERLVNLDRAVKVLLIPPARDSERRDGYLLQVPGHRLPPPELVVVGVIDEIVPGGNFAV